MFVASFLLKLFFLCSFFFLFFSFFTESGLGSNEVCWMYKWREDDTEVYGPYSSSQMMHWTNEGYFPDGVLVRKANTEGHFYSSRRIDFDLYIWAPPLTHLLSFLIHPLPLPCPRPLTPHSADNFLFFFFSFFNPHLNFFCPSYSSYKVLTLLLAKCKTLVLYWLEFFWLIIWPYFILALYTLPRYSIECLAFLGKV